MPYYAQINELYSVISVTETSAEIAAAHMIPIDSLDTSILGCTLVNSQWVPPQPEPTPPDPTEWLIDIGPFFDRFGPAKLAVLSSSDAIVRALVTDLQVRKWVDLTRPDVAQGIDLIIAAGIQGVDAALKAVILTTPVAPEENLALRKTYFS